MKRALFFTGIMILGVTAFSQSHEQLFDQGLGAFQDKLYEDALENFDAYLKRFDNESRSDAVIYMSGVSQYYLEEYTDSLDSFERLVADKPESPYLRRTSYWIGLNYYHLQEWSRAEEAYLEQLSFPQETYYLERSYLYLGILGEKREEWAKAYQYYGTLIQKSSNTDLITQAYYRSGLISLTLQDYNQALHSFEILSSDFGSSPYSKAMPYYVGLCYFYLEQYDEASRRFELYLSLFPSGEYRESVVFQLAQTEEKRGNEKSSQELLLELEENWPGGQYYRKAQNMLAENFASQGNTTMAREIWEGLIASEENQQEINRFQYNVALTLLGEDAKKAESLLLELADLKGDPISSLARDTLSSLYLESDQKGNALNTALSLFNEDPNYAGRERVGGLVATLMIEEENILLDDHLKTMIDLYGEGENNDLYLLLLGQSALNNQRETDALSHFSLLEKNYPQSEYRADALYRLGYIYVLREEYVRGAEFLEELLSTEQTLDPLVEEDSQFSLALCHFKAGNLSRAIGLFKDYLKIEGAQRAGEVNLYLGELHSAERDWTGAVFYLEQAATLFEEEGDPLLERALYLQGTALLKNRKYDMGEKVFMALSTSSQYGSEALYQAGICREMAGNLTGAEVLFNRSVTESEGEVRERALYQLSLIALKNENQSQAMEYLNQMKTDYPQSDLGVNLIFSQAEDFWALKDYEQAREWYQICLKIYPEKELTSQASLRAALALGQMNKWDEAVQELESLLRTGLLERSNEVYAVASSLGTVLRQLGSPEQSLVVLESISELTKELSLLAPLILAAERTGSESEDLQTQLGYIYQDDTLPLLVRTEALLLLGSYRIEDFGREEGESLYRVVMDSDRGELGAEANFLLAELYSQVDRTKGGQEFLNVSYNYTAQTEWAARSLFRAWEEFSLVEGAEKKSDIVREKLKEEYPGSEWAAKVP